MVIPMIFTIMQVYKFSCHDWIPGVQVVVFLFYVKLIWPYNDVHIHETNKCTCVGDVFNSEYVEEVFYKMCDSSWNFSGH